MIITCPNCKKQFKIDKSQIPAKGRNLQCGSCSHAWFYKIEDKRSEILTLNDDLSNNEIETKKIKKDIEKIFENKELKTNNKHIEKEKHLKKSQEKKKYTSNIVNKNSGSKFLANFLVCVISIAALIILVDTLKKPLINIFPGSEIILLNLFETLQDIKLFIIDLFN